MNRRFGVARRIALFLLAVGLTAALGCGGVAHAPLPADEAWPSDEGVSQDSGADDLIEPTVYTGTLTGDVVWSGVIIVTREVIVPESGSLTIQPGTRVQFTVGVEPSSKIIVEGTLYVQGNFQQFVFFAPEGKSRDWNGILFQANSAGRIAYARFQFGARVHTRSSSVQISYSQFMNSGAAALTIEASSPTVEDSMFRSNVAGIQVTQQATPDILNNTFIGNVYGIVCDEGSRPTISANVIANNRQNGILSRGGSSPQIQGNNIVRNGSFAVQDGGRLIDNFIQGNNGAPPNAVETSLSPQSAQVFGVEEVLSTRSSPVPEAGERRFR